MPTARPAPQDRKVSVQVALYQGAAGGPAIIIKLGIATIMVEHAATIGTPVVTLASRHPRTSREFSSCALIIRRD